MDSKDGLATVLGTVCTTQMPAFVLNLSARDKVREGLVINNEWWLLSLSHAHL